MEISASLVRAGVLEQMCRLTNEVVVDETLAAAVAQTADAVERDGFFGEAEALCVVARNHRIRALEKWVRFAATHEMYEFLQNRCDAGPNSLPE